MRQNSPTSISPFGWKLWRQIGQGKPYGREYSTIEAAEAAKVRWQNRYARYVDTVICLTPINSAAAAHQTSFRSALRRGAR